jgi:hypothetical protein
MDLCVGHLARVLSPIDTLALQVADDRCSVDVVLTGESIDRLSVDVPCHDFLDLLWLQPALLLTGTQNSRNMMILGGSSHHLLQGRQQLVFRE